MFEKWESMTYPGCDAKAIHTHAFQWWNGAGFRIQEMGPGAFRGLSASRWGLEREVNVKVADVNGTAVVELRMKANVTTEGILAGGIALVLLWPVAVVGGAYSYAKYESDALELMGAFWSSVGYVAQVNPTGHKEQVFHTTAVPSDELGELGREPGGVVPAPPFPPLSPEDRLRMLDDRLARGEISEETYHDIRERSGL